MTRGTPAPRELQTRIQRALDHGLTQQDFVRLIKDGRVTSSNVGRALRGDPLVDRTLRSLTRCADEWERRQRAKGRARESVHQAIADRQEGIELDLRGVDHALGLTEALLEHVESDLRMAVRLHVHRARQILARELKG